MTKANSWEVTDEFWQRVEPLVPLRQRPEGKAYVRQSGAGRGASPKAHAWCSKPSSLCCARGASGRRCRQSALAAPAPSMRVSCNGKNPVSLRRCGKADWPSTTTCRASPGSGKALMALLNKAPLAQESVGPNPTDRGKKWEQAAPACRRAWRPASGSS